MIRIRNGLGMVALLVVAGCGCTDDSSFNPLRGPVQNPVIRGGVRIKAIGVPLPPPKPIDVVFVLDDSWSFQNGFLAGDGRVKTSVAQAIMANLQAKIAADLQADPRTNIHTFDLAFGVGRYEDFGGTFRPTVPANNETVSRPWILQMPLFRQNRDDPLTPANDFLTMFQDALSTPTPGRGDKPATPIHEADPSTAAEALYQAATGAGFDGNANATTFDSGDPAQKAAYTAPGASGDVPQVTWVADGTDEDGRPKFRAAQGGALSSGDLGGMGWRRDALRYIIVASDFATVAPFNAPVPPSITGQNPAQSAPSAALRSVSPLVTDPRFGSAPTVAPAGRATVQQAIDALNALDIEVLHIGTQATADRGGKPNQPLDFLTMSIGPQSLGTLQVGETITGATSGATGRIVNLPASPAATGFLDYEPLTGLFIKSEVITGAVSGAQATTLSKPQYGRFPAGPVGAVTYPTFLRPSASDYGDPGPFTWMSVVSHLTGAYDTDFPNAADNMPLVYNLLTVFPKLLPEPTDDVREDLVDRVAAGMTGVPPGVPDVSSVMVDTTFSINSTGADPYVFALGAGAPGAAVSETKSVLVPRYVIGTLPVPADVVVDWVVQAAPLNADPLVDHTGAAGVTITQKLQAAPGPASTVVTATMTFFTPKEQLPIGTPEANLQTVVITPLPAPFTSNSCFLFQAVPPTVSNVGVGEQTYCANFP